MIWILLAMLGGALVDRRRHERRAVESAPYARWIVDARIAPASDVKLKGSDDVISASLRLDEVRWWRSPV